MKALVMVSGTIDIETFQLPSEVLNWSILFFLVSVTLEGDLETTLEDIRPTVLNG